MKCTSKLLCLIGATVLLFAGCSFQEKTLEKEYRNIVITIGVLAELNQTGE